MQDFHAGSYLLKSNMVAGGGFVDFYLGHKRLFLQPSLTRQHASLMNLLVHHFGGDASCCRDQGFVIVKFKAIMLPCLFLYVHRLSHIRGVQAALKSPLMNGLICLFIQHVVIKYLQYVGPLLYAGDTEVKRWM